MRRPVSRVIGGEIRAINSREEYGSIHAQDRANAKQNVHSWGFVAVFKMAKKLFEGVRELN